MSKLSSVLNLVKIKELVDVRKEKGKLNIKPYIEIGDIDIDTKQYSIKEKKSIKGCKKAKSQDVIISRVRPSRGAVSIINEDEIDISSAFTILKSKSNMYSKYLFYSLAHNKDFFRYLEKLQKGTSYPSCREQDILNFAIHTPEISIQKKIVLILEKSEEAKKLRSEAKGLTDNLLRGIFIQMFGDPSTNLKKFEVKKIGDICDVKTGGTPDRSEASYWNDGDIPWVKTAEVNENTIYETEELITEKGSAKSNASIYPKNSILIAMYGQGKTRGKVAKLGIDASTNQACAILLPSKNYNTDYLFNFLKLSYTNLRNLGRGGNQPNLNLTLVKQFNVILPPMPLQEKFVEIVKQVDELKIIQEQSKIYLNNFHDNLIQKAFKGELVC